MDEQNKKRITKNLIYTVVPRQAGNLSNSYTKGETDAKFKDLSYIVLGVVIVLLVMVATLVIDSFHINSATYREYSEKINMLDSLNANNGNLLEQNNQNQEIILSQQNQILELLKGK